ncbi:DNA polymerase III subunit gamma/tau [Pelotomaculum propionicicum]|uniref:DNA-directed DNA polymerase n=1 Tax=Pelotomaculum propionicicum TaxID=258475 RepID=A0A4Y7RT61_9FIRM|nr:DNA polymerase III subunit gamma/tau [Pelotomaculum propionicicum]NLI12562.1 DNA polymerase III subunit gamma/tau [Peptococcaceae bacterium]TEB12204.1 DNA polymerase III subunit tau [Pelotomaculum propionicicum]
MTYLALYREWRPRTFGEIIGQEHITRTLKNAVESGRTGHAYLFCGTRGTGKTTTAKVLAKALNCAGREGPEPCNRCESCKSINEGLSVDVIEIDAASNRGIDEIRDLREKIKFAPTMGNSRVYIIDEVHMLTNEAFNALLKTLEEPPRHAVLILATTEPHKVPLTILSRCQRFDFRRILPADMIKRLKEVAAGAGLEVEEEALRLIARAAEGGLRDALSILDQGAAFGGMKITAGDVHNILGTVRIDALNRMAGHLAGRETGPALRLVAELTGEGKDLRLFAREMAGYLRALLLEKISPHAAAEEAWGEPAQVAGMAAKFSKEGLVRAVEIMAEAEQNMKWSAMPAIVLELALVRACSAGGLSDTESLSARLAAVEEKLNSLAGVEVKTPAKPAAAPDRKHQEAPRPREQGLAIEQTGPQDNEISLEKVRQAWFDLMDIMRRERLPLYHNYAKAQPLALKGRSLTVGFPASDVLGREMAERADNKKYLEGLLGRLLQGKWQITFKNYQDKTEPTEQEPAARDAVVEVKRRFGGEEIILDDEEQGTLF